MVTERKGEWMQTFTGRRVYVSAPLASDVAIEDIAHHLSMVCRFGGAVTQFYSVAEHAVRVSRLVEDFKGTPQDIFWGLNHDDAEAYLGDIVWPLKQAIEMTGYKKLERLWMLAICEALAMAPEQPSIVKHADLVMLATEKRDLIRGTVKTVGREAEFAKHELEGWHCDTITPHEARIQPWTSHDAEQAFLERYAICAERRLGKRW